METKPAKFTYGDIRPRRERGSTKVKKKKEDYDQQFNIVQVDDDYDINGITYMSRVFTIGEGLDALIVRVPLLLGESYGTYVWPCAVSLSQYIWTQRNYIQGKNVLEIGSGTALAGMTAKKCGAEVVLSDCHSYPDAMQNARNTCLANNFGEVPVYSITWGRFDPMMFEITPMDVILGADCFYDTCDFEDVVMTVSYLLKCKAGSQFWCTYQERSANWNIVWLLQKWGLSCNEVELPKMITDELIHAHTLHLYIITAQPPNKKHNRRKSSQDSSH